MCYDIQSLHRADEPLTSTTKPTEQLSSKERNYQISTRGFKFESSGVAADVLTAVIAWVHTHYIVATTSLFRPFSSLLSDRYRPTRIAKIP